MSLWKSHPGKLVLLLASLLAAPSAAGAATIVIRTGVNASGNVLGSGASDPFWTISVQSGAFLPAEVAPPSDICCGMETVGSQAMWITDPSVTSNSSNTGWGVGPVARADRTFNLTGFNLSTVSFSGIWRVADFRAGIYLNGNLIDPATAISSGPACNPCDWQINQSFSLAAGSPFFLPGINTLEIRGSSVNSIFDGFWLDSAIQGNLQDGPAVPEPATLLLLGTGLTGIMARRRRSLQNK